MTVAYIFPGQGSQYAGMGKSLGESFSDARRVFEAADDSLGFSISRLCFEGPSEQLQLTENTQPAILAVSIAALSALRSEAGQAPAYVAGHSLGEYSANVAAGSFGLQAALRVVKQRGRYMQEAVPIGTGAMAAVIGAELSEIERVCHEASQGEVCAPANINAPNQVVIAGNAGAVDRAMEMLQGIARKVVKLNVSAPFHCRLMMPAQERLARDLDALEFEDLQFPVITNVDAAPVNSGEQSRAALVRQVSSPVRWLESIQLLLEKGVDVFVEIGPGKVLSGLMRQIDRDVRCLNVADAESLATARTELGRL